MTAEFTLAVSQNEYLAAGETELHAVLAVAGTGGGGGPVEAAEVIAIDCSGSMHYPKTKINAAKRATAAAITVLRDGVHFAVVAGTDTARLVYPREHELVRATAETRAAAIEAVHRVLANGGTAMGSWLKLADRLLAAHPNAVRHVILLTDGHNQHETPEQLDAVLTACHGRFVCDARGIGGDWSPKELLRIVSALRGTADAVREGDDLAADFEEITRGAMSKVVPELVLKVRTAPFARIRFVKQMYPTEVDLTEHSTRVDDQTTLFSTGSWGSESREFHVCLDVDREHRGLDEEFLAARIDALVAEEQQGVPAMVRVYWTENVEISSILDPKVAHFTGQAELGRAMMAAFDAYAVKDLGAAQREWGRAVRLATELGNEKVLTRLRLLVDVIGDPADGVVRIKPAVAAEDLLSAAASSVFSTRSPQPPPPEPVSGPDVLCAQCEYRWPAGTRICSKCGGRLETPA